MKVFLISGNIVSTDEDRQTFEDVTPAQVNSFLKTLEKNEDLVIEINSWGGDVAAALAICNLLKTVSSQGNKTTSRIIGVAASSASLIACACEKLTIDSNAFMMIHNPWSATIGNAADYRKEADVLDKFREAMISIYRTKFDVSDELIKQMLDSETWIIGEQVAAFKLNAEIIPVEEPFKAVALGNNPFKKMPVALKEKLNMCLTTSSSIEETKLKNETIAMEKEIEEKIEESSEQVVEETPVAEEKEEMFCKAEVEKRVSGMQSTMAKKMDIMKKEYEAKIEDFKVQIKDFEGKLEAARAESIRLQENLDNAKRELLSQASALEEKTNALATLNAGVNSPSDNKSVNWKSLRGQDFFDWYRKNH